MADNKKYYTGDLKPGEKMVAGRSYVQGSRPKEKKSFGTWLKKAVGIGNPSGVTSAEDSAEYSKNKKDGGIIKNPCDFGKIKKLMKKKK